MNPKGNLAWAKGKSGNPLGRAVETSEKPFATALKMEIAAAGKDHKALRKIARNLLTVAQEPTAQGISAAMAIADRLDGKPVQESNVNITKRDATDWTLAELDAIIAADEIASNSGAATPAVGRTEPDSVH